MTYWENVVIEEQKLQQAHLKVYSCKTYYMTTDTLKKINYLDWLKSRTWIDFHDFKLSFKDFTFLMIIIDYYYYSSSDKDASGSRLDIYLTKSEFN